MDTSNDTNSISECNSLSAKLRRLKIQEGIFINNVKNSLLKSTDYTENKNHSNDLKIQDYSGNLKKSFIAIKNLFEDIKLKTHFQSIAEKYDIEELKTDVTELESKIKTFKQYIQNELRTFQYEETVIKEKANIHQLKLKRQILPTKQYNEVVTSPVRVIINSPFKCLEVQRFQDFMKNSCNKYGGWNEYNHNNFLQIRRKYFVDARITSTHNEKPLILSDFQNEVLSKISGLKPDDLISHEIWYEEYLDLKRNQEVALNRWKENKKKIKFPLRQKQHMEITDGEADKSKFNSKRNIFAKGNIGKSTIGYKLSSCNSKTEPGEADLNKIKYRFMKPTKQWINKHNSIEEANFRHYGVDNITKLHTPTWRVNINQ